MDFKKAIKLTILTSSIALTVSAKAQQNVEVVWAQKLPANTQSSQNAEQTLQDEKVALTKKTVPMYRSAISTEPQKIFPVRVQATPTTATFSFATQVAASARIDIGKKPPDAVPQFRQRDKVGILLPTYPAQAIKVHHFKALNLKPATLYYYIIRVPNEYGDFLTVTGSFTTPIRID